MAPGGGSRVSPGEGFEHRQEAGGPVGGSPAPPPPQLRTLFLSPSTCATRASPHGAHRPRRSGAQLGRLGGPLGGCLAAEVAGAPAGGLLTPRPPRVCEGREAPGPGAGRCVDRGSGRAELARRARAGTAGDRCAPPLPRTSLLAPLPGCPCPRRLSEQRDKGDSSVPVPHTAGARPWEKPCRVPGGDGVPALSLCHRCLPSRGLLQCPHQLQVGVQGRVGSGKLGPPEGVPVPRRAEQVASGGTGGHPERRPAAL